MYSNDAYTIDFARFNHKTGAEDVHFTALSSNDESDDDADAEIVDEEALAQNSSMDKTEKGVVSDTEYSSVTEDDTSMLEMVMIKDVSSGAEVRKFLSFQFDMFNDLQCHYAMFLFSLTWKPLTPHLIQVFNTYGLLGNAALLHRYGFTEQDNAYDIVNIDMELVLQWCSSLFSDRHSRSRISLWRRLGYSGDSKNSEYFEISFDGEPQIELIILLHIIFLPDDVYHKLDLSVAVAGNYETSMSKKPLMTKEICAALLSLADIRESLYGLKSMEDDIEALERCSFVEDRKLYHSLVLRISERKIIQKLRNYASKSCKIIKPSSARKKLKRTA